MGGTDEVRDARAIDGKTLYDTLVQTRNLEIQLFWQRCNYFLVLNTGLFTAYATLKDPRLSIFMAALAVVVCWLWLKVALGSKFWQERWEAELARAEQERRVILAPTEDGDPAKQAGSLDLFSLAPRETRARVKASLDEGRHRGLQRQVDRLVLRKPSVTFAMTQLVLLFLLAWVFLLLYAAVDWRGWLSLQPLAPLH